MTYGNAGFATAGSMLGVFLLILLLFAGAYYATKIMGKHYSAQASTSETMRVIDRLALGRDQYLLIVEAGGKALLLGVSAGQIETLAELEPGQYAETPPLQENTDLLRFFKNRAKKPGNDNEV